MSPSWKPEDKESDAKQHQHYVKALEVKHPKQVQWWPFTAKDFFSNHLKLAELATLFPEGEELFGEMTESPSTDGAVSEVNSSPRRRRSTGARRNRNKPVPPALPDDHDL